MIDVIKELAEIIDKLPHIAVWVLVGLLIYKIVFIGSWFGLARLLILKGHDYLTKPKTVYRKVKISDRFICHDGTYTEFVDFLDNYLKTGVSIDSEYIHKSDVREFKEAINQYRKNKDKK